MVVGNPVVLAVTAQRRREDAVLLCHCGMAELGPLAAVVHPGRLAELIEAVVMAGVHHLGPAAGFPPHHAPPESSARYRAPVVIVRGLAVGMMVMMMLGLAVPSLVFPRPEGSGRRRDPGRLARDVQLLADVDVVGPADLVAIVPVDHGPVVPVMVEVAGDGR